MSEPCNIKEQLEDLIWQAVQIVQNDSDFMYHRLKRDDVVASRTKNQEHGDYTTNVALKFKPLKIRI